MAKRRRKVGIPGLTRRGDRAYFHRRFPKAVGGDLLYKSLECDYGTEESIERAGAVNTLWSRGDWPILRRWKNGEVHVSEIIRAVREGAWDRLRRVNADGRLLGDVIEKHLKRIEATRGRSGRTAANHRSTCNALLDKFGADRPLQSIGVADAEEYLHAERLSGKDGKARPWALGTQALRKHNASSIWQYVIDREAEEAERTQAQPTLTINPWRRAEIGKRRKIRPAVLSPEEIRDLLANENVRGTPRATLCALCAWAGLRLQEATNLRTATDVVLDGPDPHLKIQSREGGEAWETKTDRSERDVPITPALMEIIEDHLRKGYNGERYLLCGEGRKDGPINSRTAHRWIEVAFTAAGIQYGRDADDSLTLHGLRHSYATMLLSQGISIAVVAEFMGDTQEVVLSTYSHSLPKDRDRALKVLEAAARGDDDGDA